VLTDPFEHFEEFSRLRGEVQASLRSGVSAKHGIPLLCWMVLPSFENTVVWDLYSRTARHEIESHVLTRSLWRMDVDLRVLRSPIERLKHPRPYLPTIERTQIDLSANEVETLMRRFREVSISLTVPKPLMGCDGTTYELALFSVPCELRLRWWESLPEAWAELRPGLAALQELLESAEGRMTP
jgi:hypothetical protein